MIASEPFENYTVFDKEHKTTPSDYAILVELEIIVRKLLKIELLRNTTGTGNLHLIIKHGEYYSMFINAYEKLEYSTNFVKDLFKDCWVINDIILSCPSEFKNNTSKSETKIKLSNYLFDLDVRLPDADMEEPAEIISAAKHVISEMEHLIAMAKHFASLPEEDLQDYDL